MAPEVMCRKNHSYTADYFAVGVMAYEFMLGRRPYIGKSRKEIRDQILSKQATVKLDELPNRWSLDAVHFINQVHPIIFSSCSETRTIDLAPVGYRS